MGGACSKYGGEVRTGFGGGKLKERAHLEGPGMDGRIILISYGSGMVAWTGLNWLRIGTGGGLL